QAADLTITPATVTITADAQTKVYGDTDPALTYTVSGLKGTDTLTGSLVREAGEAVGTYEIQQGSVAAPTDYTLVYQAADLTITPATVTITADAQTKVYGDADPALTYTVSGLKGTDTLTGSLVREAGESIGTYEIQQGSVAASTDYTIVYEAADLEITPAVLTITATPKTKNYGATDPVLTYEVSGLQRGEQAMQVLTGQLVRQVGEAVGTYAIEQGSLVATANYTLVYEEADFVISPIELVIYPQQNQEKEYGTDDPALVFTVIGLSNGDTIATALRGTLGRSTGENVGRYRYTLGSLESIGNNYVLRLDTEGRFEITPAPIAIVVETGQYKRHGQTDPVLRYAIQGLRRGDYPANIMTGQLKREPGEDVGQYAIIQGSLASRANYIIRSFTTASFEIKRGEIQGLSLPSKTVVYDGEAQYLQVEGPLGTGATVAYENNGQTQVGRYTVVATITDEPNYEPLRLLGTLTITPAEQHIRFGAISTVVLEDTPSLPLQAVASSGLAVTYTIEDPAEQALAEVDAAGVIHFLKPGVVTVTAHQEGNANYKAAVPVSQTIEVTSRDASIWDLLVDGVSHGKIEGVVELVLDCSTPQEEVVLEIITQVGAVVKPSNYIVIPVTTYGIHEQVIEVESANGQVTTTYIIRIDKRMPTEHIVFQKYDKVLLVNNNKQTNGGYAFSGYEWFKNGLSLGKKQFYAEQGDAGTTLDVDAEYLVELTLHNGQKIRSCPIFIQGKTTAGWTVYPNPVQKSAWLYVRLEEEARQEATTYKIYNITGQLIKSGALDKGKMGIEIPPTVAAGSYYLILKIAGKQQGIQFIVQ
ncbi:MBG domain-containing protein, partial [Myroides sp. C15-4]|uniref:MBG domain-containing protein n=1 Tax=Myroides sp. C15-4 TaxID=3400532 RepID=UPI003D2F96EB